jgi:hypothetical protein
LKKNFFEGLMSASTLSRSPAWLALIARAQAQQPVVAAGASTTISVPNSVAVQTASVVMTAAQFIASKTAPIQLLPKPNIGTYYIFVAGCIEFHYGTTVPASNNGDILFTITEPSPSAFAKSTTSATFVGANADCFHQLLPFEMGTPPPTGPVAVTYNGTAYTGVTDGAFVAKIWYIATEF